MPSDARQTRCRTPAGGSSWRPPMVIAGRRLPSWARAPCARLTLSLLTMATLLAHRVGVVSSVCGTDEARAACSFAALPHGLRTACTSLPCPPPLLYHLHIQALTASDRSLAVHRSRSFPSSPYRPLTHLQQQQPLAAHTAACPCLLPFLFLGCHRRAMPGSIPHFSCNTQNSITSQPPRTAVRTSNVRALWAVLTP